MSKIIIYFLRIRNLFYYLCIFFFFRHEEFYDETFIDELVQKIIYENWNFSQGNNVLHCLNSIRHVQMDLLDYLSAKLYEEQTNLTLDMNLLFPLVTGITLGN